MPIPKKEIASFKKQYKSRWKQVMYATENKKRRNSGDALEGYREMPILELAETASLSTSVLKQRFESGEVEIDDEDVMEDICTDLNMSDEILNEIYDALEEN